MVHISTSTLQCPNLPIMWLCMEHPHVGLIHPGFIRGRYASQHMGLVDLLALSFTSSEEARSEEKRTIVERHWLNSVTAISFRPLQSEHANGFNTSYRCYQSHSKVYDWHANSSRRSIVELSRERITPRILSRTSLKYYIHFSFILKLIIFIYKQLKRPVAFSVVQLGSNEMEQNDRAINLGCEIDETEAILSNLTTRSKDK